MCWQFNATVADAYNVSKNCKSYTFANSIYFLMNKFDHARMTLHFYLHSTVFTVSDVVDSHALRFRGRQEGMACHVLVRPD